MRPRGNLFVFRERRESAAVSSVRGHGVCPRENISLLCCVVGDSTWHGRDIFPKPSHPEKKRMEADAFRIIPLVSLHFDLSSDLTANRQPTKNNGTVIVGGAGRDVFDKEDTRRCIRPKISWNCRRHWNYLIVKERFLLFHPIELPLLHRLSFINAPFACATACGQSIRTVSLRMLAHQDYRLWGSLSTMKIASIVFIYQHFSN